MYVGMVGRKVGAIPRTLRLERAGAGFIVQFLTDFVPNYAIVRQRILSTGLFSGANGSTL